MEKTGFVSSVHLLKFLTKYKKKQYVPTRVNAKKNTHCTKRTKNAKKKRNEIVCYVRLTINRVADHLHMLHGSTQGCNNLYIYMC